MGVQVVGVSFDTPADNLTFKEANELPFPLWSDVDRELALFYGAADTADQPWAFRVTVVLDPEGRWTLVYPAKDVNAGIYLHPQNVADDLALLLDQGAP